MMSLLTQKHDEAKRLLETYTLHKDSEDINLRRKVHLDLDRFLMENRETAIICIEQVLQAEIEASVVVARKVNKAKTVKIQDTTPVFDLDEGQVVATKTLRPPWYQRLAYKLQRRHTNGGVIDGAQIPTDATTRDA